MTFYEKNVRLQLKGEFNCNKKLIINNPSSQNYALICTLVKFEVTHKMRR